MKRILLISLFVFSISKLYGQAGPIGAFDSVAAFTPNGNQYFLSPAIFSYVIDTPYTRAKLIQNIPGTYMLISSGGVGVDTIRADTTQYGTSTNSGFLKYIDWTTFNTAAIRANLMVADSAKWNNNSVPSLIDSVNWNTAYTRSTLLVADSAKWNNKLNITDTASMLSPYLRTANLALDTTQSVWGWNSSTLKIPVPRIAMDDYANKFTRAQYLDTLRGRTGVITIDSAIHGNRGFEFVGTTDGITYSTGARETMAWIPSLRTIIAGKAVGTEWDYSNLSASIPAGTDYGYNFLLGTNINAGGGAMSIIAGRTQTERYSTYENLMVGEGSTIDTNSFRNIMIGRNNYMGKGVVECAIFGDINQINTPANMNFILGNYDTSSATYGNGYGNWLFGQYLHVNGKGSWIMGSDDSFTGKLIPFPTTITFYGEPVMNWSNNGMSLNNVGSTRVSTSYQSANIADSVRYISGLVKRGSSTDANSWASFDIGSARQFSINGSSGHLDNAFYHTYLSFNYDSLQGIYFNPTSTDGATRPFGNVIIANGALGVGTSSIDSGITTASTVGAHIGRGLLIGGNASIGGTITSGLINGQTISSTANFTGTATFGGDILASTGRVNLVSSSTAYLQEDGSNLYLVTVGTQNLYLGTHNTIRMTLYSGGGVNILGLPTSSSGLVTGDLWEDTTGGLNYIKMK